MNKYPDTINWLLQGDVSVQYNTHKKLLLSTEKKTTALQKRIATDGWGKMLMDCRMDNGIWGNGLYSPKWISTHYTLLQLKNMGYPKGDDSINSSVQLMLDIPKAQDGGINITVTGKDSDVCVNGMILNYSAYFLGKDKQLNDIVDYLLKVQMKDGGWNCMHKNGATHSSLHSTLSVLEGLHEFRQCNNTYKRQEITSACIKGHEFILLHHLYKSHRTGNVISSAFILLSYPCRWKYDILKALEYFADAGLQYDIRMEDALQLLLKKRRKNNTWPLQGVHPGLVHFKMEEAGKPSRWNTLRALYVLTHFGKV